MKRSLCSLLGAAILVTGCTQALSPDEIIAQLKHTHTQDSKAAILLLKTGIQSYPEDMRLRQLIAQQYYEVGDYVSAEKELQRLYDAEFDTEASFNLLTKTLYHNTQYDALLALTQDVILHRSDSFSDTSLTNAYLFQGLAYFKQDEVEAAKHSLLSASEVTTDSVYGQLSDAINHTVAARMDEAIALLDEIIEQAPELLEASLLKAQLLTQHNRLAEAANVFADLHTRYPLNNRFALFYASSLIANSDFETAAPLLKSLREQIPQNGHVQHLLGAYAFHQQDFMSAKMHAESALKNRVYNVPVIALAGLSSLQVGNHEQAKDYLDMIVQKFAEDHPITQAKILVNNKLGYEKDNLLLLSEQDLTKINPALLSATAYSFINIGDLDTASELIQLVNQRGANVPDSILNKNRLLAIALNDQANISELEAWVAKHDDDLNAKQLLALAQLKNKNYTDVITLTNDLNTSQESVGNYILQGMAQLGLGQHKEADNTFKQVLTLKPNNMIALHYFTEMHMANGQIQTALDYALRALQEDPQDLKSLDYVYRLSTPLGKLESNIVYLQDAYQKHSSDIRYRILLATARFALADYDSVKDLLAEVVVTPRTPTAHYSLLSSSYLQLKQPIEAKRIFAQWRKHHPKMLEPYIKELALLELEQNWLDSLELINQALRHHPRLNALLIIKATAQMELKRFAEASITLNKLTPAGQQSDKGKLAKATLAYHENRLEEALVVFSELYEQTPRENLAHKIADVHFKLLQPKVATDFLATHIDVFPEDRVAKLMYASKMIDVDIIQAINALQTLNQEMPNNVFIVNNLAYAHLQAQQLKKAENMARQALELQPENPNILDTFGLIKAAQGENEQALLYFKMAYQANPYAVEIALNYSEALIDAQQISQAKRILTSLSTKDDALIARLNALKERVDS
jgi:putative PEP-CTERM system TPR-repeat lipoprotein